VYPRWLVFQFAEASLHTSALCIVNEHIFNFADRPHGLGCSKPRGGGGKIAATPPRGSPPSFLQRPAERALQGNRYFRYPLGSLRGKGRVPRHRDAARVRYCPTSTTIASMFGDALKVKMDEYRTSWRLES